MYNLHMSRKISTFVHMRQDMETIEILSAELRNVDADRDRIKKQADADRLAMEEYKQKYEQAVSSSQLANVESMVSQMLGFIMGKGDCSLAESISNPIIKALEDKHKETIETLKKQHKAALKAQADKFAIERELLERRIRELEGKSDDGESPSDGITPSGDFDMSMTDGHIYNTLEEAEAALAKERNRSANLIEDAFGQTTESNRYCGRPAIDAEKAELEGEDVKRDVFDESSVVSSAIDKVEKAMTPETKKSRPRREQPLSMSTDPLRTEHKWIEPEDCPEGAVYKGNEEKVSYVVMKSYIKAIHYHYKFYEKDGKYYKAKRKPNFIKKCMAEESLIAYVLYQHYANRMSVDMIVKEVIDMGFNACKGTIQKWIELGADKLKPLMEPLRQEIISDDRLHSDETHLDVESQREEETKSHYHNEWMYNFINTIKKLCQYVYKDGDRGAYVVVDYVSGSPVKKLYLHADGAKMYETFHEGHSNEDKGIVHVPCGVHLRRPFWNLRKVEPDAQYLSSKFDDVLRLEREYKKEGLSAEEIKRERLERSSKILQDIADKLDELSKNREEFKHADLYAAVDYVRKLWPYFLVVLERGDIQLENNICEQQMRPIAIYRNNSLFCGSHEGAGRLANVMSLIQSCRLNGVKIYDYSCDVLGRIDNHIGSLVDLLPHKWKPMSLALSY